MWLLIIPYHGAHTCPGIDRRRSGASPRGDRPYGCRGGAVREFAANASGTKGTLAVGPAPAPSSATPSSAGSSLKAPNWAGRRRSRRETRACLHPWHDRLKAAYVDPLADLGVTVGAGRRAVPRRDQGDGQGRHRQTARASAGPPLPRRGAPAALGAPGPAPRHPGCRHLQGAGHHAPQDGRRGEGDRPVPARTSPRLRLRPGSTTRCGRR